MTCEERRTRNRPWLAWGRRLWARIGIRSQTVSREGRSDLLRRALSSAIMLPTVLLVVWQGGWWFFFALAAVLGMATWEYVRMLSRAGYQPTLVFALGLVGIILADLVLDLDTLRPAVAILLLASMSWHILGSRSLTRVEDWLLSLGGALYIGWIGSYFYLVRALPRGAYRLFVALAITILSDMGGYFVGQAWGKHRLAPKISPGKTWEGLLGGIVAALVSGPILSGLGGMGWGHGAILGLLLSTLTPLGDLGVSMIKRQTGAKDTGNLIPGHGGVLDRIDSHLVAAFISYYYYVLVIGALSVG
jgi:phosphatidate cytidylyltransferase